MPSLLSRLLDLIAPRSCAICQRRLAIGEEVLCASCTLHLPRTNHAESPYDNELSQLFYRKVPVERAAALFYYEPGSCVTRVVKEMKYHNHPDYGVFLGRLAATEFSRYGFFEGIEVIVPMPLAPTRLRQRGFNQSMELAKGISGITGLPIAAEAVKRTTFKVSQARSAHTEREENVKDAFEKGEGNLVKNRHVLLVDDIVTTGATMSACLRQLIEAGAEKTSIICMGVARS